MFQIYKYSNAVRYVNILKIKKYNLICINGYKLYFFKSQNF